MRDRKMSSFPQLDMNNAGPGEKFKPGSEGSRGRVDPVAREKMEQVCLSLGRNIALLRHFAFPKHFGYSCLLT